MKNHIIAFISIYCFCITIISAQDETPFTYQTFKSVKVVNMHTTETLPARTLDIRIGHKFGDLAGSNGGWQSFFGLENAADIMIGADYGITDNIGIGIARVKGSSGLFQNLVGTLKYKFLRQKDGSMPLSAAFVGIGTFSTQRKSDTENTIAAFEKFAHRLAYSGQLIFARKFSERFSFQISPGYVHRNIVEAGDSNGLFFLGAATRLQISKVFGIIVDANIPFSDLRTTDNGYYPILGIGLEMATGGHIFQLNFTKIPKLIDHEKDISIQFDITCDISPSFIF